MIIWSPKAIIIYHAPRVSAAQIDQRRNSKSRQLMRRLSTPTQLLSLHCLAPKHNFPVKIQKFWILHFLLL